MCSLSIISASADTFSLVFCPWTFRLEFAVIGDPVNVAARVERLTRETGDAVLVTEATRCLLSGGADELEPRGDFALKGVSEPVPIYALSPHLDESLRWVARTPQAEA